MNLKSNQRTIIDEWIHTSRYVYNKTIHLINTGHPINHFEIRDKLVTENTKKNNKEYKDYIMELQELINEKKELQTEIKGYETDTLEYEEAKEQLKLKEDEITNKKKSRTKMCKELHAEKNNEINEWELHTPKAVRDSAVSDVCKAYKTGFTNLKLGNIKHFKMGFKRKDNPNKCVCIPKSLIKIMNGTIELSPQFFKDDNKIKMGKKSIKKHRDLKIDHDSRIVKQKNEYWLIVPIATLTPLKTPLVNYCGVDPGIRTFMTTFGNNGCVEYRHNEKMLKALNNKIAILKDARKRKNGKRIHKRKINKLENRKSNLIDELHWKVITKLLSHNDVIFYGDIKSHDIVKNNKNKNINKNANDLKFYKFKERLLFKASEKNKRVVLVNEAFTSQTCSCCGAMYKPGSSKIYNCISCKKIMDRDLNAAKNILMKGIMCL